MKTDARAAAQQSPPVPALKRIADRAVEADPPSPDLREEFVRSVHRAGALASPEQHAQAAATMNELLSESDDASLLVLAAWMLTAGHGYAPDPVRARALLDVASAAGDKDALFELYLYDLHGVAGEADAVRAMRRLQAAAHAGSVRAMANLGALYATGAGVPRDEEISVAWYRRAADGGNRRVAAMLASMFAQGIDAPRDARLAERYARLAATDEGVNPTS